MTRTVTSFEPFALLAAVVGMDVRVGVFGGRRRVGASTAVLPPMISTVVAEIQPSN